MGNRACIVFFDSVRVSPTIYLHWHGGQVPLWLDQLRNRMQGRFGDAHYAAARFVGICHTQIDGNLGLGVISNNYTCQTLHDHQIMESVSPGNAGMVVVDTRDFTWRAYGGYLADTDNSDSHSTQERK